MKRLITARDVEDVRKSNGSIIVSKNVIITPSAADLIRQYKIRLVEEDVSGKDSVSNPGQNHLIRKSTETESNWGIVYFLWKDIMGFLYLNFNIRGENK